ncbi:hypothetical protein AB0K16_50880 [Nonomuraea jabiensis]
MPLFHVNGLVAGTLSPLVTGGQVSVTGRFGITLIEGYGLSEARVHV